jgi:hypothetical protein
MKSRILFTVISVVFLAMCITETSAQEITLLAGPTFSKVKSNDGVVGSEEYSGGRKAGINFGVLAGFEVYKNIQIQSGLMLVTKGYKIKEEYSSDLSSFELNRLTYLEVPILAKYSYEIIDDLKVFGAFGPAIGIAIGGKWIEYDIENGKKIEEEEYKIRFGKSSGSDVYYKRLDLGLLMQAGVSYKNINALLFVRPGLNNFLADDEGFYFKNRVFGFSFGYTFNIK